MGFATETEYVDGVRFEVTYKTNNTPVEVSRVCVFYYEFDTVAEFDEAVARTRRSMVRTGMPHCADCPILTRHTHGTPDTEQDDPS